MRVVVVTPPEPVVDLVSAKAHLRVEHDVDDVLIQACIDAVTAHLDGPDGWLGRALGPQTLRASFDRFTDCLLPLPYPPLIDVVSVKYDDGDGVEQTVSSGDYTLDPYGVLRGYSTSWPSARQWPGSVRVTYRAGYAVDPEADPLVARLPAPIKAALLLMLGDLYANRETTMAGEAKAAIQMSTTVENLLGPFRVWQP